MPWGTITRYSLHALAFGLGACAVWLAGRLIFVRRPLSRRDGLWLATVGYVAMVLEIIGLRIGLVSMRFMGGLSELRLHPMEITLYMWRRGPGMFIYHVVGNMLWFVPVGVLMTRLFPRTRWYHALLAGAALSLLVECMQLVLGTGVPDVDDLILNTAGAVLGYLVGKCLSRLKM